MKTAQGGEEARVEESRGAGAKEKARVGYLEALAQRLAKVFCDLVHADATHRSHGEGAHERVGVLRILFI